VHGGDDDNSASFATLRGEAPGGRERIVASLATQCHLPIGEMATLYEHERAELALGAHITKYLHIFATRNVLDILRQRDLDKQTSAPGLPAPLSAC
jgi:hypothetical protein